MTMHTGEPCTCARGAACGDCHHEAAVHYVRCAIEGCGCKDASFPQLARLAVLKAQNQQLRKALEQLTAWAEDLAFEHEDETRQHLGNQGWAILVEDARRGRVALTVAE